MLEEVEKLLDEEGEYLMHDMMLLREKMEKMSDSDKKAILLQFLDAMIMGTGARVSSLKERTKLTEHRAETPKMMKQTIEKM